MPGAGPAGTGETSVCSACEGACALGGGPSASSLSRLSGAAPGAEPAPFPFCADVDQDHRSLKSARSLLRRRGINVSHETPGRIGPAASSESRPLPSGPRARASPSRVRRRASAATSRINGFRRGTSASGPRSRRTPGCNRRGRGRRTSVGRRDRPRTRAQLRPGSAPGRTRV